MNNNSRSVVLGAVLLMCGCTMAPSYTRPPAPIPEAWPNGPAYAAAVTAADAPLAADIPWREFYTDKRMQQVIETALANNRDLRLAALNVQRARAIYGIQRSAI